MEKPLEQNLASRLPPERAGPLWGSTHPGGKHTRLECSHCFSSIRAWPTVPVCGLRLPVNPTACLDLPGVLTLSSFHVGLGGWDKV